MRGAALVVVCLVAAGCGAARHAAPTSTAAAKRPTGPGALRVAVIGRMRVPVARGAIAPVDQADLVVVARRVARLGALVASRPEAHFVLVGRSFADAPAKNVSGLLFRDDEAGYLAGVVAGLVTVDQGGVDATVAWVGGHRREVTAAFARGVHSVRANVRVLDAWSEPAAARCKEAALDAISRGAGVVFAGTGACAEGALAGAADQNAVGLRLANFERPEAAVAQTVRDAEQGLYHGGEDVVFGAASGAVGIGRLDPRVSPDAVVQARQVAQELADGLRSAR
jgi:basic membrane lipoprotein Med (substrate-binding protein (PBP1-ABC) superfamily)